MADITNIAYDTTWGTIRITNLYAKRKTPRNNPSVDFKAFVNSFRDSFNPGWSEHLFPNQSSPIAHQVSPKRTIQISFSVPSYDAQEAITNMRKCTFLAESMYPILKHEDSKTHSLKSTFMGIKFANLIQSTDGGLLPGYIMGFVFVPNLDHGVHIDTKDGFNSGILADLPGGSTQSHIIPKLIDIDLTFTPIEMRESFGYHTGPHPITQQDNGHWANNGARPYGTKIVASSGLLPSSMGGDLAPNSKMTDIVKSAEGSMFD